METKSNIGMEVTTATVSILKVEKDSTDGLLVTFSDGTVAGYVVDELLNMRPVRDRVKSSEDSLDLLPTAS